MKIVAVYCTVRCAKQQGACQHCDDQVLMVEGLRVHGCVRPIHKIVPATPDGLVQYMHDATIR